MQSYWKGNVPFERYCLFVSALGRNPPPLYFQLANSRFQMKAHFAKGILAMKCSLFKLNECYYFTFLAILNPLVAYFSFTKILQLNTAILNLFG